jgi:hypothetical protein
VDGLNEAEANSPVGGCVRSAICTTHVKTLGEYERAAA